MNLEKIEEVFGHLQDSYIGFEQKDVKNTTEDAIQGIIQGLSDGHTQYFSKKDAVDFEEMIRGDFEGIGAYVEKNPLGVFIERFIAGSPAKNSGMRVGDIIIEVDTAPVQELSIEESIDLIRGPADSSVMFRVFRQEEQIFLDIEVKREKINIPTVYSEYFEEESIGYIALSSFSQTTSSVFLEEMTQVLMNNPKGLILDLRDNGGGLLGVGVDVLSVFFTANTPVVSIQGNKDTQSFSTRKIGEIYTGELVVLINENSASASEIVAGALQDYNRATIVGTQSYGKGSVQELIILTDGSEMKVTTSYWFTPKMQKIEENGITPDEIVEFEPEDYENMYDRQLEFAKSLINP